MAMIRNGVDFRFVPDEYDCVGPWKRQAWCTEKLTGGLIIFGSEAGAENFAKDLVKTALNEDWFGQPSGRIPLLVDVYEDDKGQWVVHWDDSLKD